MYQDIACGAGWYLPLGNITCAPCGTGNYRHTSFVLIGLQESILLAVVFGLTTGLDSQAQAQQRNCSSQHMAFQVLALHYPLVAGH